MRTKYILEGVAVTVSGAFVWVFLYLSSIYEGRHKLLVALFASLFGLLMASIYLVPLGAILGLTLPPLATQKPLPLILLAGFLGGVVIAGISSLLVVLIFQLRLGAAFLSMCPVCSFFVIGWMLLLRRNALSKITSHH